MYSCIPDGYGKSLCRALSEQLKECWRKGDIDIDEAKQTVRTSLMSVVDFKGEDVEVPKSEGGEDEDDAACELEWHHLPKRVEV